MTDSRPGAIFLLFLRLGATAFGGPAAHIALMEDAFVRRRGWSEAIVGADSRLYCYDTPCERNARTASTPRRPVAATRRAA